MKHTKKRRNLNLTQDFVSGARGKKGKKLTKWVNYKYIAMIGLEKKVEVYPQSATKTQNTNKHRMPMDKDIDHRDQLKRLKAADA